MLLALTLALLLLVNDYRMENGAPPLLPSAHLTEAAQWMAEDISEGGYWSHTDSLGGTPFTRMRDAGFGSDRRGEVLAWGSDDPATILGTWRFSPGHNAVILDTEFMTAGIGFEDGYWVMDLGGCRSCPKTYPQWRW